MLTSKELNCATGVSSDAFVQNAYSVASLHLATRKRTMVWALNDCQHALEPAVELCSGAQFDKDMVDGRKPRAGSGFAAADPRYGEKHNDLPCMGRGYPFDGNIC